jgi:hypothetical protein
MATEEIWIGENDTRRKLEGEELQEFLDMRAAMAQDKLEYENKEIAKADAKVSAIAKLTALGLTKDEADAILS